MGTRADFYVGRGRDAKWIGSVAFDGYPDGIDRTSVERERITSAISVPKHEAWPDGQHLFDATTEADYLARIEQYFENRSDVTRPAQGWPWPWNDSGTSDYAYAFDDGRVWHTTYMERWWPAGTPEPEEEDDPRLQDQPRAEFPDMTKVQNVTLGRRSGLIVLGG